MNEQVVDLGALRKHIDEMPMQQFMQLSGQTKEELKRNPKNFRAHITMAMVYLRTEQTKVAVNHLIKAHKIQPKAEHLLRIISELLMKPLQKFSDALKYLRKLQNLRRNDKYAAQVWALMAECYIALGRSEEAVQALDNGKRADPNEQRIYLAGSAVHSTLGKLDAAMVYAKKALEIEPNNEAFIALSALPNFGEDKDALASVTEFVDASDDPKVIAYLYGVIAKAHEKSGDYVKVLEYFVKSNEFPRKKLDREKEMIKFRNLRSTFTRNYLNENSGLGHKSTQPVFIVGMPRSGTTLTESILAGHPKVTDNGEQAFFGGFFKSVGLENEVSPLLQNKLPSFRSHFDNVADSYFRSIAENYLERTAFDKKNKNMQVDKMPHNFMAVGLISIVFPNAKIIHCRRHPVDCALSCYKQTFREFHAYATDLEFLGLYYRQYWELMKHWREVLPGKMFEICYEDTVANKELVARNLIDHIDLEWDDRCLDHTASKTTVSTASQWQVRQPIYTTSVAKWKHYEKQLQPMIKNMGSCVEEYEAELAAMSG